MPKLNSVTKKLLFFGAGIFFGRFLPIAGTIILLIMIFATRNEE